MDNVNNHGVARHLYYMNYWHPTGESDSKEQLQQLENNNQEVKLDKKWKILMIISALVVGITLFLEIYNALQAQKLANLNRNVTPATNVATSSHNTSVLTTDAPTTLVITTMALCIESFLRYGDKIGDKTATDSININFGKGRVAGITVTSGTIAVDVKRGSVMLNETDELITLQASYGQYDEPDPKKGQFFYYRQVDTAEGKEAIGCLVKDDQVRTAYVFTWIGFTQNDNQVGNFQCIIVFSDKPATYSIRTYSQDIKVTAANQNI